MKLTLIHPPMDDPTIPYHSTAYLKGHLVANGFHDVSMRDVNVEYVNWLLQPATVGALNEEANRQLAATRSRSGLNFEEQERHYGLLATSRTDPAEVARAASELRTMDSFLDFPHYVGNLNTITGYMAMLGVLSYPADQSCFSQMTRGRYSTSSMRDLLDPVVGRQVAGPFQQYFEETIASDPMFVDTDLFGISIVYDHQIYQAFQFARLLKERWPEKRLVFGGTAISQLYKYLKDKSRIKEVFGLCDAIVIGEGETAICEIAASDGNLERGGFTNTITYRKDRDEVTLPEVRYENVTTLGRPLYDHSWELYLSPERGINYSPTRGCYWNRCTFCDYGLNTDKPTSPWRERKINQVVEDLEGARRDYGVKYVYFAVDVMAPGYLERLSDAICDTGLDIRWSAEVRMEKIFSEERARKMRQSGCVCVSFGMESGNQRVLDLIDKGTKVQYMSETMKNFSNAGVACQLMAFTDFPTETPEELQATHEFIRENEPYWAAGGLGTFLLTGNAIIAKQPEKFGISLIETQEADIVRSVAYRVDSEGSQKLALTEDADSSFDRTGGAFPDILGRPWAGGTDSLHTMIYYNQYGASFFKQNQPNPETRVAELSEEMVGRSTIRVNGQLVESQFDLGTILANRERFAAYLDERLKVPAEPTHSAFRDWTSKLPALPEGSAGSFWLLTGKQGVKLDKLVYRILGLAAKTEITVGQILAGLPETLRTSLLTYIRGLEAKGLISFKLDGSVIRSVSSVAEEEKLRNRGKDIAPEWKLAAPAKAPAAPESVLVQIK